jgi:hypothetical protein
MLWALLAAFLRSRPVGVQAAMFGLCTGLFVVAGTVGAGRLAQPGSATLLVLVVAVFAGGAFAVASVAQPLSGSRARGRVGGLQVAYAAGWVILLVAAVRALLGAGGYRVAVFAIVPLVLLAPPALVGLRALTGGRAKTRASLGAATCPADGSASAGDRVPDVGGSPAAAAGPSPRRH